MKNAAQNLKGAPQLLKESWQIYHAKIRNLLVLVIGFFVISLAQTFLEEPSKVFPLLNILIFIIFIISLFITLALIYAIKEDLNPKKSFQKAIKIFPSYIWVIFLSSFLILGGFGLAILPGIAFSIWFSLAIYVLLFEERRGMEALLRSKDLISGYFWKVLLRYLVLGFVFVIVALPVGLILGPIQYVKPIAFFTDMITFLLRAFLLPFGIIYEISIFQNLREIKAEIPYQPPPKKRKIKYVLIGVVGMIVFLIFFGITMFMLSGFLPK